MTDRIAGAQRAANMGTGPVAMTRLADRLAALAPPRPVMELTNPLPPPQASPAVRAALHRTAELAADAKQRAQRHPRSLAGRTAAACAFFPYAAVALVLRLVMARVFLLDGLARFEGPQVPLDLNGVKVSMMLPLHMKAEALAVFLYPWNMLPVPATVAAYLVGYAELLLPFLLLLGLGTRIAAFGLLVVTALIQFYVMPQALWSAHVYWASMLLVLLALGAGQFSIDGLLRLARRD